MTESMLTGNDRLLITQAREIGPALRASTDDRDRLAGWLLRELADLAERLATTNAPTALKLDARDDSAGEVMGHSDPAPPPKLEDLGVSHNFGPQVTPHCPKCGTGAPHVAWTGADKPDVHQLADYWQCTECGAEWQTDLQQGDQPC